MRCCRGFSEVYSIRHAYHGVNAVYTRLSINPWSVQEAERRSAIFNLCWWYRVFYSLALMLEFIGWREHSRERFGELVRRGEKYNFCEDLLVPVDMIIDNICIFLLHTGFQDIVALSQPAVLMGYRQEAICLDTIGELWFSHMCHRAP